MNMNGLLFGLEKNRLTRTFMSIFPNNVLLKHFLLTVLSSTLENLVQSMNFLRAKPSRANSKKFLKPHSLWMLHCNSQSMAQKVVNQDYINVFFVQDISKIRRARLSILENASFQKIDARTKSTFIHEMLMDFFSVLVVVKNLPTTIPLVVTL
jgi:hypothetical protein